MPNDEIREAILVKFSNKFINCREQILMSLLGGQLVIKLTIGSILHMKPDTKLNYGSIEKETVFDCKPNKDNKNTTKVLKITGGTQATEGKQIFKENFNF